MSMILSPSEEISTGSFAPIPSFLRSSLGTTIRPSSSMFLTMPVDFIRLLLFGICEHILPYYGIKVNIINKKEGKRRIMERLKEKSAVEYVLSLLPSSVMREIKRLSLGRCEGLYGIREIRIRRSGVSSFLIGREEISLLSGVGEEDMEALFGRLIGGALYAHRDSIAEGYISIGRGVRVGVCGRASYDGSALVGVSDMTSLAFRIPTGECLFHDELYSIFASGIGRGMIIYSPPGVGKTTAIRSLAYMISGGTDGKRVAIIDERGEFDESDYLGRMVDILCGYKKAAGIEIATRTLSPQIIMVDEIGVEDAEPILSSIRCGVPIIATAHAGSVEELLLRKPLRGLFEAGAFEVAVGISLSPSGYDLKVDRL